MHIRGPFSDDTWDWFPQSYARGADAHNVSSVTSEARVFRELGIMLLFPLAAAVLVGLFLSAPGI